MSTDRQRERRGRHSSVAGAPAEEALNDLVRQFSDRYAFVRELIQNSLDANASRVDIALRWEPEAGRLVLAVHDDGEGMDRETIEGYLLVLFRSTKEEDRTRIGKFGIGFVSLFALEPEEVLVDTGRDQVWHRVIFDAQRRYTLLRMDEPREGTTVTLHLRRGRAQALHDALSARESAVRWCRYAEAQITTAAEGFGTEGWPPTPIAQPFALNLPVVVEERGDGFHALLGPARVPSAGFYNHGLTLWEGGGELLPGVSFKVKGRHLEHTLTRDNVRRGPAFDEVMRRLRQAAEERLGPAVHEALAQAAPDPARRTALWGLMVTAPAWRWDHDAPIVPVVGGGACSLVALRRALPGALRTLALGQARELLWAPPDDPLGRALQAQGRVVVAAEGPEDPHLGVLAALLDAQAQPVGARFTLWEDAEAPEGWAALAAATEALARRCGWEHPLRLARLHGTAELAVNERGLPGAPQPVQEKEVKIQNSRILIRCDHPLLTDLLALPPTLAAPLLLRALRLSLGDRGARPEPLAAAALAALPREPAP